MHPARLPGSKWTSFDLCLGRDVLFHWTLSAPLLRGSGHLSLPSFCPATSTWVGISLTAAHRFPSPMFPVTPSDQTGPGTFVTLFFSHNCLFLNKNSRDNKMTKPEKGQKFKNLSTLSWPWTLACVRRFPGKQSTNKFSQFVYYCFWLLKLIKCYEKVFQLGGRKKVKAAKILLAEKTSQ